MCQQWGTERFESYSVRYHILYARYHVKGKKTVDWLQILQRAHRNTSEEQTGAYTESESKTKNTL